MNKSKQIELDEKQADEQIFTVKEKTIIPDGKHNGIISDLQLKKYENYAYVDMIVKITDMTEEPTIRYGFNANLSDYSQLGIFLKKSGFEFEIGDEITFGKIKDHLIDRKIRFKTVSIEKNISGQKLEFSEIVLSSIDFIK